jgi:decaprenyl-phosphate phosphoribosyltransferase
LVSKASASEMLEAHATATRIPPPPQPAAVVGERPTPGRIVLRACRPRQWLKNVLVALAPAAGGVLTRPVVLSHVAAAFVCFCLISSATYLVNDVRDRHQDRLHPRKRHRPVAAGELRPRGALRLAALFAAAGLGLALLVRPLLALVCLSYLAVTTGYSIWWRRLVVADVVAVAAGFVIRTAGGATAGGVGLSRSFLIVVSGCALFIVAGKRYAELGARRPSRRALSRYSRRGLRLLLTAAAGLACAAYAWWAFARAPRMLSLVPFVLWLARYRGLLQVGAGEAPEELVTGDSGLLALGLLWAALFAGGIYA